MDHADSGRGESPSAPRVLLVDDNAEGRTALARYLELNGFRVTTVSDGASALASFQNDPAPDVVLTDLVLPDTDGREIGRHARLLKPRPLIALITGWVFESGGEDLANWGIDLLFYKPLDVKELLQKLKELTTARAAERKQA